MEDQIFPVDVDEWTWDTIEFLRDNEVEESTYLEYKKHISYPETEDIEPSEKEWRRDIEREFTAFANGSGGIIVFGMDDDIEPAPFEIPEHEVRRTVNQFVKDTTPVVKIQVSDPLELESPNTDRIALAVRVFKAERKPVKTSDSAYYFRVNDQKQPMSREQLESIFIEADRRQQAVRQLEMEISRFRTSHEEVISDLPMLETVPPLEAIDENALRDVFLRNTHLFSDEDVQDIVVQVMDKLDQISHRKFLFQEGTRNFGRVPHDSYRTLNNESQVDLKDCSERLMFLFDKLEEETQINPP